MAENQLDWVPFHPKGLSLMWLRIPPNLQLHVQRGDVGGDGTNTAVHSPVDHARGRAQDPVEADL
jgi:hypothetical protein